MKKFTKTLSIVLLVAMCMSMFTISSFAANGNCECGWELGAQVAAVEKTCTTAGHPAHYPCTNPACSNLYWDAEGNSKMTSTEYVIPAGHEIVEVSAADANCQRDGWIAHQRCEICDAYFINWAGTTYDNIVVTGGGHDLEAIAGIAPTCETAGVFSHRRCTVCGTFFDATDDKVVTAEELVRPMIAHNYNSGFCTGCGAEDPANPQFDVTGTTPVAYSNTGNYVYQISRADLYEVTRITVGGNSLYEDAYSITTGGRITIFGNKISSIIDGKQSVQVEFYGKSKKTGAEAGSVGGFYISNKTTVETLTVDGFDQKGFIKGSTEAVAIRTNDVDSNNVRLYSVTDKKYIGITDMEFTKSGDMYTFTFTKAFLDTLDYGTYHIRCFYGENSYVSAGTIIISNSTATKNSSELKFTNSTVDSTEYKFVSGGTRPELYCLMFRDKAAKLQYSNDGYSWKDVSVYDYYIEQSNGKSTAYAWLKNSMLDSMKASSNVYFRVIIPASAAGTTADVVSNWVKVTTGNNIRAVDTDKHVINSAKSLKFTASTAVDVVKVGSIALVEGEDYAISKDKKTITLLADFLNKRTAGSTYTLTAVTPDGEDLKTTFQILTTAQASSSPRTGDDSNIALWSALVLLSGAAVVAVLPRLKKEQ